MLKSKVNDWFLYTFSYKSNFFYDYCSKINNNNFPNRIKLYSILNSYVDLQESEIFSLYSIC